MPALAIVPSAEPNDSAPCACEACANIARAKREIDHGCDGPLTAFVLISRAARLAERRKYDSEAIANALLESLTEYGWIFRNCDEETIETGS